MEGFGNASWENIEGNGNERDREEVPETGTRGNKILEVGSRDEQEKNYGGASSSSGTRQKCRHTPYQIQELENYFMKNPHPSEKKRSAIGKKLNLEVDQVKFWFQNRRTQVKTQAERHDNAILKQENDQLRLENSVMKEAIESMSCHKCGGHGTLKDKSSEKLKQLKENARLKDEVSRMTNFIHQMSGKPLSSLPNSLPQEESTSYGATLNTIHTGLQRNEYLELASKAMDELIKLGKINAPVWTTNIEGGGETLNFYEYTRAFPPLFGSKPLGFVSEASRARGVVSMSSVALVEALLDANQWREMFVGMIGSSTTMEVISSGTGASRNGVLQLMNAEIQLISPLVPARVVKFIRFSRQQVEGVWVVVDFSMDPGTRRRPSGCILHDMPNGFTTVTWIEHIEYDENLVHHQYRRSLSSGIGFGGQKWICALLRHCECLQAITSPIVNHGLLLNTRRCLKDLAQRMTSIFCAGVCLTGGLQWDLVTNHAPGTPKIMARKTINDLGEPSGIILSVAFSFWIPTTHQHLFDLLLNKDLRCLWDVLCHKNARENMIYFPLGRDETSPNSISILSSENPIMVLQETASDMTGSLIVYTTVDNQTVTAVMMGEDTSSAALLPLGIYIVPAGYGERGSMVTVGFQVLILDVATCDVTMDTISTVNDLVTRTVQGINDIVQSSQRGV